MRTRRTRKQRQRKKRRILYYIYGLLLIAFICVVSLSIYMNHTMEAKASFSSNKQTTAKSGSEKEMSVDGTQTDLEDQLAIKKDVKEVVAEVDSEEEVEIEVVFAGDTMFDWQLRPLLDRKGYDYPFLYIKDAVKKADYSFINAETVFTENPGTKDPDQLFWINSDVKGLQAIVDAGFTMINIGNNHTLDYMEPGLLDTLENVKQTNMEYIGAGKNEEEAYESKEVTIKGKKLRFFSFVRFFPNFTWVATPDKAGVTNGYDLELVKQTIEEQKGDADYTIVYFHWGVEKTNTPVEYQKEYVRELKEIGVDLIVGSHAHWLQGFEYYEGMAVAYSIGNFLFPPYVTGRTAETGLLKVTLKGDEVSMSFDPYMIDNGQIIPAEGSVKQEMFEYLQSISFDVKIDEDGNIKDTQ